MATLILIMFFAVVALLSTVGFLVHDQRQIPRYRREAKQIRKSYTISAILQMARNKQNPLITDGVYVYVLSRLAGSDYFVLTNPLRTSSSIFMDLMSIEALLESWEYTHHWSSITSKKGGINSHTLPQDNRVASLMVITTDYGYGQD